MSDPPTIAYKVLTADEMVALERDGTFAGSEDDRRDGFIHLSTADQLIETIERHFAGRVDLHVVAVDLGSFAESLKLEKSRNGALFPHLYAPLPLETLIAYGPLERGPDGAMKLPVAG